ncbi:hypothetical protein [Metapseudomonas otitidis]|uniref:hypothetical protein n=1 Tax=Metapseudomonas otitidis TaxID=319939 RepID=UPI0013F657F3|nr:hypothetical protein [Pseudomonas otitidis]
MNTYKWIEIGEFPEGAPTGEVEAWNPYAAAQVLALRFSPQEGKALPFGRFHDLPRRPGEGNRSIWYVEEPWFNGTALRQFILEEVQE